MEPLLALYLFSFFGGFSNSAQQMIGFGRCPDREGMIADFDITKVSINWTSILNLPNHRVHDCSRRLRVSHLCALKLWSYINTKINIIEELCWGDCMHFTCTLVIKTHTEYHRVSSSNANNVFFLNLLKRGYAISIFMVVMRREIWVDFQCKWGRELFLLVFWYLIRIP